MDNNTSQSAVSYNAKLIEFAKYLINLDNALVQFDHKRLSADLTK